MFKPSPVVSPLSPEQSPTAWELSIKCPREWNSLCASYLAMPIFCRIFPYHTPILYIVYRGIVFSCEWEVRQKAQLDIGARFLSALL